MHPRPPKSASYAPPVLAALLLLVPGCGTPPTQEEATAAIGEMADHEMSMIVIPGDKPTPPAAPKADPKMRVETFPMLPAAEISSMKCDRVGSKTYDCDVTWSYRRASATTGRYRLVRGPEKWTATDLKP